MFEVEHFEDIQNKLSKVECTGKSRVLLDMLQDRKCSIWLRRHYAYSRIAGIKGWLSRKKKNPPRKRSEQRKRRCLMCRHSDSEDLKITFECKHILCTDCFYAIEDETTEDGDTVNALSRA
jgi:hypothetical protein